MYAIELAKQILRDMATHKIRSILALFGIVWGTVSVVALLALGQGFYTENKKNMGKLAGGAIFAFPGKTSKPFEGTPQGMRISMKVHDILGLPKHVRHIKLLSPSVRQRALLQFKHEISNQSVIGVTQDFRQIEKMELIKGSRFINKLDVRQGLRVTVIGDELAEAFFHDEGALNKTIKIAGLPFVVVGVVQHHDSGINFNDPRRRHSAYIPYSTFLSIWGNIDVSRFTLVPDKQSNSDVIKKALYQYFGHKYRFDSSDENAIFIPDTGRAIHFFDAFFRGIQIFLGFCGAMTLAVGGIGVTNIMFLIVSERTREIGLRMALGAKGFQVMLQVMFEASIIVGIGGVLGSVLSWLIVAGLYYAPLPSWLGVPTLSYPILLSTLSVLSVLAVLAGFFPARRASRMDPVKALSS